MIPVQNQNYNSDELFEVLTDVAHDSQIKIYSVSTGLTKGIDLGSNDFDPVRKQKVALLKLVMEFALMMLVRFGTFLISAMICLLPN